MTSLRAGWATDPGRVRALNEDSLLVAQPLFLVADGMGGHAAGEVASRIAVDTMRDLLGGAEHATPGLDEVLVAVEAANLAIFHEAGADQSRRGMGTTLTGVTLLDDGDLAVVNVGDSRVYLRRDGSLHLVTRDHTYVEELLAAGEITAEQARVHPHRHVITHALGIEPGTRVDSWTITPRPGDRFLVCSDGLTNEVDDPTLAEVLADEPDPQGAADALVRLANDFGGRDNITVVVVDVVPDDTGAVTSDEGDTAVGGWLGDDVEPFATTPPPPPVRPPDAEDTTPPPAGRRRRATIAAVVFVAAVIGVLVAGAVAIQASGRSGYYIGFDSADTVAIFRGKPAGVLWVDPTRQQGCGVAREDLSPAFVERIAAHPTYSSLAAAVEACARLAQDPEAIPALATTTTAPPPTTTTTTSTVPPATVVAVAPTTPATAGP